jgi:hypothetical protein
MVGDIVEPLSSMADFSTPAWKARARGQLGFQNCDSARDSASALTGAQPGRHGWRTLRRMHNPRRRRP